MLQSKWQWVSDTYGGMGWFTEEEKRKHEGTRQFSKGHWRPIPQEELDSMNRAITRLAYEQS